MHAPRPSPLRGCSFVALCPAPPGCGTPTEEALAKMRAGPPPASYPAGTSNGRLTKYRDRLLWEGWQQAREGVDVILPADEDAPATGSQAA